MSNKHIAVPEGMGKRIKECMEKSNINAVELANLLGMERKMIYQYQKEEHSPNVAILGKMCKIFNVTADYLIFGEKR